MYLGYRCFCCHVTAERKGHDTESNPSSPSTSHASRGGRGCVLFVSTRRAPLKWPSRKQAKSMTTDHVKGHVQKEHQMIYVPHKLNILRNATIPRPRTSYLHDWTNGLVYPTEPSASHACHIDGWFIHLCPSLASYDLVRLPSSKREGINTLDHSWIDRISLELHPNPGNVVQRRRRFSAPQI